MCLSGYMCFSGYVISFFDVALSRPNIDAEPSSGGGGPEPGFSQLVVSSGVGVRHRKRTTLPSKQGGWETRSQTRNSQKTHAHNMRATNTQTVAKLFNKCSKNNKHSFAGATTMLASGYILRCWSL